MALQIEANYSKKIGLPGYSSHQFSITVKAELSDISQVEAESSRLYALLQSSVDRELQQQGYVPGAENNGHINHVDQSRPATYQHANARNNVHHRNGHHQNGRPRPNNHQRNGFANRINIPVREEPWKCSQKQQELILKMVNEHQLDKNYVEQLSIQLFGIGVRSLNKLQASGLIDEVIREVEQKQSMLLWATMERTGSSKPPETPNPGRSFEKLPKISRELAMRVDALSRLEPMSSMDLRKIEESKIACARKFFAKITSDQVKYEVVNSYGKLMELVK